MRPLKRLADNMRKLIGSENQDDMFADAVDDIDDKIEEAEKDASDFIKNLKDIFTRDK